MSTQIIQQIVDTFERRGNESYGSEPVTQLQHAIQTALLAKRDQAEVPLVVAALLHDIGHLLGTKSLPTSDTQNYDDKHENKAYGWLLEHFGSRVADPVRLHVAAKRYLCTIDPSYGHQLSPTSRKSFYDQGGVMDESERTAFESEPHFKEALRLRKWDDEAKDPNLAIPSIEAFTNALQEVIVTK